MHHDINTTYDRYSSSLAAASSRIYSSCYVDFTKSEYTSYYYLINIKVKPRTYCTIAVTAESVVVV